MGEKDPVKIISIEESFDEDICEPGGPLETVIITGDYIKTNYQLDAYGHSLEKVKERARSLGCNVVHIKQELYGYNGWGTKIKCTIETDLYRKKDG